MDVLFGSRRCNDWESVSESSEDQEELEVLYGGQAMSLLSNLDEAIGKIDDFLSFERAFFHGDVVCLTSEPSGQMGRITSVDMLVDLESTNGKVIRDVHSKQILKIRSLSIGDYVLHGYWLGRVDKVIDLVTVVFTDGTKCDVIASDQENLVPISSNTVDDPQYPFYPGQRVRVKFPTVSRHARWLCRSWNGSHKQGTICGVKAGMVYIHWMASVINGWGLPSPSKLQDAKDVTLLPCFTHTNWQLGDLCLLPRNNNGEDFGLNIEEVFVVAKTRTKLNVIWQDGTESLGLDSKSLLPINIVDAHEFWTHQFVVEKTGHEQVPKLKWGCVQAVDAKEKTVKVKWEKESGEETVSAYELLDHPDYSFCIGDVVFRLLQTESGELTAEPEGENFYLSCIGNVVGFKDGVVEVKWASGLTTMVDPHEIFRFDNYGGSASSPLDMNENVEQITQQMVHQDSVFSNERGKGLLHYLYSNRGFISKVLPRWSALVFIADFAANLFRHSGSTSSESSRDDNGSESQDFHENVCAEDSTVEIQTLLESDMLQKSDQVDEINNISDQPSSLNRNDVVRVKQFDMVTDCSDHFFLDSAGNEITSPQVNKSWLKKVGQEWSILQKNLPEGIFVRTYEERMDLFRAAIIGAPGTPYHDGIFFFDIFLPPHYPNEPPRVHYHSGGVRLNPNLYESGKVCLSLLNTWRGGESEVWNPQSSTLLQVLVSLQALVLNEKPYFNEAGYDTHMGKTEGEKNSVSYNENAFLLTCQTMIYLLRNPPKHFEEMVVEHFRSRCPNILGACKEYISGAPVGFASSNIIKHEDDNCSSSNSSSSSTGFKIMLSKLFDKLIDSFTHEGIDCGEFVKAYHPSP